MKSVLDARLRKGFLHIQKMLSYQANMFPYHPRKLHTYPLPFQHCYEALRALAMFSCALIAQRSPRSSPQSGLNARPC